MSVPGRLLQALLILPLIMLMMTACTREELPHPRLSYQATPLSDEPVYVFAIHPLYSPGRLFEKFSPLIDYVNARLEGAKLKLEASRDYPAYDGKIRRATADFLLPNPFQTLIGMRHGYRVIGKVADDEDFHGIILVRREGGIRDVADLKGGVIAAPGPTALAATMLPKYFLASHGLDVRQDVRYRYTGTQESAMMALYLREADAATTWPVPWRLLQASRPDVAASLKVAWRTHTLPSNSVMVHDRVPEAVAERVIAILVDMSQDDQGRRLLAESSFSRFVRADNGTYAPVETFIRRYSETVEPIEIQ